MHIEPEYIASLEVMSDEELAKSLEAGARLHKLKVTGKAKIEVRRGRPIQHPSPVRNDRRGNSGFPVRPSLAEVDC
jgi:hypothetical protein